MKDFRKVAVLFVLVVATVNARLNIEVYYEATDRAFREFITNQLLPTYKDFHEQQIEVNLVPYGHSFKQTRLENGTWEITCVQDAFECYYDKIHACAIGQYDGDSTVDRYWKPLNYVNCLVDEGHIDPAGCAARTCFDDAGMAACVNTLDGDDLLVWNGIRTAALGPAVITAASLPIVTVNGEFREDEQLWARQHLLSLVCNRTANPPAVCISPRARRVMTHENFQTGTYYPVAIGC